MPPPAESLAHRVPADIGLFAEARAADDLLLPLIEPELWTALAEAVGQPARPEDVAAWREQIARTVKFDPDVAIRLLFSRRVAFVGEGLGRTQDAVVLCRPMEGARIEDLLRIWQAQPVESAQAAGISAPELYRLALNIGLVSKDGLLLFGDLRLPQGMFKKVAGFLRDPNGPALADDAAYRALLARVPAEADGVLFARLSPGAARSAAASQAVDDGLRMPDLPGPLRGAANVLFALQRQGPRLHFTAVGDAPPGTRKAVGSGDPLLPRLPRATLLAWDGRVEYADALAAIRRLPENNALRLLVQTQAQGAVLDDFVASLRPRACVALGVVGEVGPIPPTPALALLIPTRDANLTADGFTKLVGGLAAQYSLVALASGQPALELKRAPLGAAEVRSIDLTPLLAPQIAELARNPELCWIAVDDVLVVATHLDWLTRIVDARRGRGRSFAAILDLTAQRPTSDCETLFAAHSGAVAELTSLWLEAIRQRAPEVMNEAWWRANQPRSGRVRLGIDGVQDHAKRRLKVTSVAPGTPSDGVLRTDDVIVGCNGKHFATSQPVKELTEGIDHRPHARFVELLVEREGVLIALRLAVPFVDPIQALKRVVAIGGLVRRAVYFDDIPDRGGARGLLTLELRGKAGGGGALDEFLRGSAPAQASQPAPTSQPSSGGHELAPGR